MSLGNELRHWLHRQMRNCRGSAGIVCVCQLQTHTNSVALCVSVCLCVCACLVRLCVSASSVIECSAVVSGCTAVVSECE
jgi:hypothetical protein